MRCVVQAAVGVLGARQAVHFHKMNLRAAWALRVEADIPYLPNECLLRAVTKTGKTTLGTLLIQIPLI